MARQLIIEKPGVITYAEVNPGPVGPDQIRLKTILTGISHGTEMVAFLGQSPFIKRKLNANRVFIDRDPSDPDFYPYWYAGYDLVGEVIEKGEKVTNFSLGDRVFAQQRHVTECVVNADDPEVFKLPASLNPEDAIMISLGTVAFNASQDAEILAGETVVVSGGGIVGQFAVQAALNNGAGKVILLEPDVSRREMALSYDPRVSALNPLEEFAPDGVRQRNGGLAPDIIIECSGNVRALATAIKCAAIGGTVIAAGFYAGPASDLVLGEEFLTNRITLKASMGVWGCPIRKAGWTHARQMSVVLDWLDKKLFKTQGYVSLRVPFDRAQEAYDTIKANPRHLKSVLTF